MDVYVFGYAYVCNEEENPTKLIETEYGTLIIQNLPISVLCTLSIITIILINVSFYKALGLCALQ